MQQKFGHIIRVGYERFENWRAYTNSRKKAHSIRKKVVNIKGVNYVGQKQIKMIKEYSNDTFGSSDYWPWLALYTEIREEFIEGWIPDDYYRFKMLPKMNPESISKLSTIKSHDHMLFKDFSITPIAVQIHGQLFDHMQKRIDTSILEEKLDKIDGEVVIKWDSAPTGDGVIIKDSKQVDLKDFKKTRNYVIQPFVKQHSDLSKLYDKSVNTLRIVTVMNEDKSIQIILTILRFGLNGARVDKMASGGMFIAINEDGRINSDSFNEFGLNTGNKHPDTGFEYRNLKIPSYHKILKKCKKAHDTFPYMKFIAWDVYLDENAEPKLIEWNTVSPGMWRYEASLGPLWNQISV